MLGIDEVGVVLGLSGVSVGLDGVALSPGWFDLTGSPLD